MPIMSYSSSGWCVHCYGSCVTIHWTVAFWLVHFSACNLYLLKVYIYIFKNYIKYIYMKLDTEYTELYCKKIRKWLNCHHIFSTCWIKGDFERSTFMVPFFFSFLIQELKRLNHNSSKKYRSFKKFLARFYCLFVCFVQVFFIWNFKKWHI